MGRFGKVEFDALSVPERVVEAIWRLDAEVWNGGFDQYYFNSSGNDAHFAVRALETIGAHDAAAIVRDAHSMFPGGVPPTDQAERRALLKALESAHEARLNALDDAFNTGPDLAILLFPYVEAHAAEIEGAADAGFGKP